MSVSAAEMAAMKQAVSKAFSDKHASELSVQEVGVVVLRLSIHLWVCLSDCGARQGGQFGFRRRAGLGVSQGAARRQQDHAGGQCRVSVVEGERRLLCRDMCVC